MATPQKFKNDAVELKFQAVGTSVFDSLNSERTDFFDEAFSCFLLGELIWDNDRAPLANAIPREIFRTSFEAIFNSFLLAGTFESYLSVFEQIFGADVEVTFTVPAPGKLEIDILAAGVELSNFAARIIESETYVYDDVITQDEVDEIMFQTIKGFTSQYELEQMLFEMVPAGIYTEITLSLA